MIRRRAAEPSHESSSDEEDDAFTALSKKEKREIDQKSSFAESKEPSRNSQNGVSNALSGKTSRNPSLQLPASTTSSMKRHHVASSNSRKSKMDALLQELEAEKDNSIYRKEPSFVPDKKGSFVEPWEEHLTTNIFVGNLAPSITEEALTDMFRQFGDLYSVKIMWPRTPEERARNRNTGFVCFMNREDAEEAMEACDDADPFNVGRRLMLRWGKNVKKIVKHGTGGAAPIQKRARSSNDFLPLSSKRHRSQSEESGGNRHTSCSRSLGDAFDSPVYDPEIHETDAIRVKIPRDPKRASLITTVASFIAKDGAFLERKLIETECDNPIFSFLTIDEESSGQLKEEHIFYRWRVYAFCQGDGMNTWRTKPFVMVNPGGRFWIPPFVDRQAALLEEEEQRTREESMRRQKQSRRRYGGNRELMTGRQIEQRRAAARAADGGATLTETEVCHFNALIKQKLCASRAAICEAMAFCFEKSAAAKQISSMLKDVLTESRSGASIETRIARLFLLSDVLFNSQQPGVRNAFLFRDAIERMAPEVFTSLGKHRNGYIGRLTMNKLSTAVSSVLGAWTNWSVYNPAFIDELHARFEGREIAIDADPEVNLKEEEVKDDNTLNENEGNDKVVINIPRGDWSEVTDDLIVEQREIQNEKVARIHVDEEPTSDELDANIVNINSVRAVEALNSLSILANGINKNEDVGGNPVDDIDGEPINDIDGEPINDIDGEPINDIDKEGIDDIDGEPINDIDNEGIDDIGGEPINDIDGELVDGIDGSPIDDEDLHGEQLS